MIDYYFLAIAELFGLLNVAELTNNLLHLSIVLAQKDYVIKT